MLPCPFCDGVNVTDRHVRDGRQMFCQNCGASVAPTYHGPNNDTLERAREAWNRRASISPPIDAGWQSIETAPKDGTAIFAYRENTGWEYFVVKWIDDRFFTLDSDYNPFSPVFGPPSHWMPLPSAPSSHPAPIDGRGEGWKLAPVRATDEMIAEAEAADAQESELNIKAGGPGRGLDFGDIYRVMLAAASHPAPAPGPAGEAGDLIERCAKIAERFHIDQAGKRYQSFDVPYIIAFEIRRSG